jgi:hypothetical protein
MRKLLLCTVLAMLAAAQAQAADERGRFRAKGVGSQSCASFLTFDRDDKLIAETWWAGYVTAVNIERDNTYDVLPEVKPELVNRWLDGYCKDNPDHLLAIAVHRMIEYHFPKRAKSSPNR